MKNTKTSLAIVGIGLRLPGDLRGPDSFWQALKDGKDCITEVPSDRWNIEKYYDPSGEKIGKVKSKKGGFIKGFKEFDADFFGIYPTVANSLDPRQRHLLEVVYESFEDANLTLEEVYGSETAVMMGIFLGDEIKKNSSADVKGTTPHTAMGSADTSVPARIAFQFNLTGPTFAVDTACSSSLVAIHLACNALWNNEAKMAVAGGVNLMTSHEHSVALSRGGFLSSDGYCKAFDASANGYVRGEGAAVIVIKPLAQAIKDKNHIYALIRNSVVNSDGYTEEGITVPNEFAQMKMLEKVYGDAGINPATVDFVEAHGTGTVVGDPKECYAFGNVFSKGRDSKNPLIIGSVKTNIGHCEAVAGVAGLIKLALSIKNKKIPQNLHFKNPNPKIKFAEWKLKVADKLSDWPAKETSALGGVNSFGAGGTNAHIILQEYRSEEWGLESESAKESIPLIEGFNIFALSAKNKKALKSLAQKYISFLSDGDSKLQDICFGLLHTRSNLPEKLAVVCNSKEQAISALQAFVEDKSYEGLVAGNSSNNPIKIAFICSGQGPQWYAMGRQLIQHSKIFRETIEEIDAIFKKLSGTSLLAEMNKDAKTSRISETKIAQPAIMAIQIGLIHLWESLGIKPEGIVGHSIGEVAAAYCAGSLTLKEAVEVIYNRSKEQDKASGAGKMLALGITYAEAKKFVSDVVSIAAINGPEMVVLSGESKSLELISEQLTKENKFNKFLVVNVPFHSHYMDVVKDGMIKDLEHIHGKKSQISLYSTVTGKKESGEHLTSEYWYKNVRDTVFFIDAVREMIGDGFTHFIEIAPHPILGSGVLDVLKAGENRVLSSLSRNVKAFESGIIYEPQNFLSALSKIWIEFGHNLANKNKIDFSRLFTQKENLIKLPSYAWQHQEYWIESKEHEEARIGKANHPFLKNCVKSISNPGAAIWELELDKSVDTYLEDHKIEDVVVFPGTGQLELAHQIAKETFHENFSHLSNITFNRAIFLSDEKQTEARLEITNQKGDYKIYSRLGADDSWQLNGSGTMIHGKNLDQEFQPAVMKSEIANSQNEINLGEFYANLKKHGLNYGPKFRLIKQMWRKGDEVLAKVELGEENLYDSKFYNILPNLLDAALHAIFSVTPDRIYLPHSCDSYRLLKKPVGPIWSYIKITTHDKKFLCGDFFCFDQEGSAIYESRNIKLKLLENANVINDAYRGIYEYQWKALEVISAEILTEENLVIFSNENYKKPGAIAVKVLLENSGESRFKQLSDSYEINGFCQEDFAKLFAEFASKKIDKFVNLIPASGEELLSSSRNIIDANLYLLQEIAKLEYSTKILLVTSNSEVVLEADKAPNFVQGLACGMVRVFINEYPQHSLKTIDTDQFDDVLLNEINLNEQEKHTEIALRNSQKFVRQLVKVSKQKRDEQSLVPENLSGTYLITGGASGLGLALAEWLCEKGIKNFALVSRNGPKDENDFKKIETLEKLGAKIIWKEVMADVTKEDDVARVVKYIADNMQPLKGVIHCAGLLEDATYPNMTSEKFMRIFSPKAVGAWNLHKTTLDKELDVFLLISSVSSVIGIAGQNNYSSANSFLDHLAIHRNACGLTAKSACLGLLGGEFAGMAKGKEELVGFIERSVGTLTMSQDELLSKIEFLIFGSSSMLMLAPMSWKNYSESYPISLSSTTFRGVFESELKESLNKKGGLKFKEGILSCSEEERVKSASEILLKSLASILGTKEENIKTDASINKIGLDSLMLNQFRNWIQNNLEVNLSLMKLAKGPSIVELASEIVEMVLSESKNNPLSDASGIAGNDDLEISANNWIVKVKSSEKKAANRIICLHPVGAGASMFSYFMFNPPAGSEVLALQLPGRENRSDEPFYNRMSKLIPDMANAILPFIDSNTIFWGHSWGGVAMFEIAKYLRNHHPDQAEKISNLVVSASIAPQLTKGWKSRDSIRESADESSTFEKVVSTVSYIEDENFLRKILPVMRKDMEMIMTYKYKPEANLNIPITAFGALEDDVVLIDEIKQWSEQTSKKFTLHQVNGDHWFLSRNKEFINQKLKEMIG